MVQTTNLKKKKKKWITLLATKDFGSMELGETFVDENEKVVGKVVCANMMNLTRDMKRQNVQLYFIVKDIANNEAHTELYSYEIVPAFLRRVTKKAKERVDHSFELTSQDNVKFRVKPVMMTKGVAHHSIATLLRKASENHLSALAKKSTFADLMKSVIAGNLQKDLKNELKKIYPLNSAMIKFLGKASH